MEIENMEARPGVPMERKGSALERPESLSRQQPTVPVLKRSDLDQLTAVFGTAQPPKGISGVLRRAAYGIPEHKRRRWLLLMLADRVDVMESFVTDSLKRRPVVTAAAIVGVLFAFKALRR